MMYRLIIPTTRALETVHLLNQYLPDYLIRSTSTHRDAAGSQPVMEIEVHGDHQREWLETAAKEIATLLQVPLTLLAIVGTEQITIEPA